MDPWADTSAAWSPTEVIRPAEPSQIPKASSPYNEGPADPWAEPSHAAPSIPIVTSHSEYQRSSSDEQYAAEEEGITGQFDPWGGNSAPQASISNELPASTSFRPDDGDVSPSEDTGQHRSWPEHAPDERDADSQSGTDVVVGDEDDPWGSGAAARRIKAEQEAEASIQRTEILRLQEEAKGKAADVSGQTTESQVTAAEDKEEEQKAAEGASSIPAISALSGWRSLFNKTTSKGSNTENEKKEVDKPKDDPNAARNSNERIESPRSSATFAAPRLWQAPTILGNHARSTSTASQTDSVKETSPSTTTTKGRGWEVTTKKQQASGGGGLIQSLFGGSNTSSSEIDQTTVTTTKTAEKKGGLNRFGRGMQPPPVVSAADDEEGSFDTEETGIEWDSSSAFDENARKRDLLSDDIEEKSKESAVGKLLGRWRGKNTAESGQSGDFSNNDLSWLESVGGQAGGSSEQGEVKSNGSENDWLAFIEGKSDAAVLKSTQLTGPQSGMRNHSTYNNFEGSNKSTRIPTLAPPPAPNVRSSSPLVVSGSNANPSASSTSRHVSGEGATKDSYSDFDEALVDSAASPNLDGSYRDDAADNVATLLNQKPGAIDRRTNSFLRSFQAKPSRSRYDYDDDAQDEPDDTWSAFRDDPSTTRSAAVYRDKGTQDLDQHPQRGAYRPKNQATSIQSPTSVNQAARTWDRNGPLLPPPSRPSSVAFQKQAFPPPVSQSPPPPAKGTSQALSQGKTLTSDDLSFFESL